MNILFYTDKNVDPSFGGIERVTDILARTLMSKGVKCVSAYVNEVQSEYKDVFEASYHLVDFEKDLRGIVVRHNIDVVINQSRQEWVMATRRAIAGLPCKLVFAHHLAPGWVAFNYEYYLKVCCPWRTVVDWLKLPYRLTLGYWLMDRRFYKERVHRFAEVRDETDAIVLLSSRYKEGFLSYCGSKNPKDAEKLYAIHNPHIVKGTEEVDQSSKGKEVVIVARMSEVQKRISLALRIWKKLMSTGKYDDWKLTIVGDGESKADYERQIRRQKIRNVEMVGHKSDPKPYYDRARIFMMTSKSEAWPMTVMEALDAGAVPVVFGTFDAIYDMIEDGKNGFIVKPGDVDGYISVMEKLMGDEEYRRSVSGGCRPSLERFSADKIADDWIALFGKLTGREA